MLRPHAPCVLVAAQVSEALGLRNVVVKGVGTADGRPYVLRRMDGKQVGSGARGPRPVRRCAALYWGMCLGAAGLSGHGEGAMGRG